VFSCAGEYHRSGGEEGHLGKDPDVASGCDRIPRPDADGVLCVLVLCESASAVVLCCRGGGVGLLVAYAAMFGFDKLKEILMSLGKIKDAQSKKGSV
jgi:hypothetical protein